MIKAIRVIAAVMILAFASQPATAQVDWWLAEGWRTDFTKSDVDFAEIRNILGPDRIPAIDNPLFVPIAAENELADREPVIGVVIEGEARAYPLRIMMWHEIVNDVVGGLPVAVTYCPLCNTAIVFDRTIDGEVLDFGTSGKLRFSDLIMYDRQTQSWWQQFSGRGLVGEFTGTLLAMIPSRLMSWSEFREEHPDGRVLVPSHTEMRAYWLNPYQGYDTDIAPFLYDGPLPTGMNAMERVVLVRSDPLMIFTLALIEEKGEIVENGITIRWNPGQLSALDAARIDQSREVGGVEVVRTEGGVEVPVVHDVTFAFVVNAFEPLTEIRTE